jgi:hypothetical protein
MENVNNIIATSQFKSAAHQTACEKTYFAQPYDIDAQGFYFSELADYEEKALACKNRWGNPAEEFEIQFIDGDNGALFDACAINQANLKTWFDDVERLEDNEKAALFYLVSVNGFSVRDAMDKIEDVTLYTGHLEDAAEELFDECYAHEIPENLRNYIDYKAFANDCQQGGDMCEFEYEGETYTVTNANGI